VQHLLTAATGCTVQQPALMSSRAPKRARSSAAAAAAGTGGYDSDYSDGSTASAPTTTSARSAPTARSSAGQSRPRKRFLWSDSLHRDFIAAVFDVGLKSADPKTLSAMLPEAEVRSGAVTQLAVKAALQKMRSFRYQMRKSAGGDSLETQAELAQRGGLLEHSHSSHSSDSLHAVQASASVLSRLAAGQLGHSCSSEAAGCSGTGIGGGGGSSGSRTGSSSSDVLQIPEEVQRVIDRLEGGPLKQNVELVAQSVQVQRSVQAALARSIASQRRLQDIMMQKVSFSSVYWRVTSCAQGFIRAVTASYQCFRDQLSC
jgi:hypothetical protein